MNVALPDAPLGSVAVTVTGELPGDAGVPLINPVEESIVTPTGSPDAE